MLYILSGTFKNHKILSPKGLETRPTTSKLRESLFNICQNYIEDAYFLDVFAGSGAMGIEALSRGAKQVTFIDESRESIRCIRENLRSLGIENQGQPLLGQAFDMIDKLNKQQQKFDIIYMDPPYGIEGLAVKLIKRIDEGCLLKPHGMLFIEESKTALIDKEGWHTLRLKSARKMGRSQLLQFEQMSDL